MDLLFELATWHGLAKLRLHTESTLRALESSTTRLGIALRKFQLTTCAEFETRNLPSEEAARGRRKAAKAKLQPTKQQSKSKAKVPKLKGKEKVSSTLRAFGLSNYKTHALADYPSMIREFGTTDGYSTQNVSFLFEIKSKVKLTFMHRESWNTAAVKDFIPVSTRESLHQGLHEKYAVNASSNSNPNITTWWSSVHLIRNKKHSHASHFQLLSQIPNASLLPIRTSAIKCQTKHGTLMIFQG